MKILESHNLLLRDAVKFAKKYGISISYSALQGMLNKVNIRNNTFIIPQTMTRYLRFNKAKRGCVVEICEVNYE